MPPAPTTGTRGAQDARPESVKFKRDTSPPFDREDADLVIRTKDNVDFHVHRLILSIGSHVFDCMLSFPQPPGTDLVRPVVELCEDGETIGAFLRIIYPVSDPEIGTLGNIRRVLAAGMKYEASAVVTAMRAALVKPQFLDSDPLRVFAIACLFSMETEAKRAAKRAVWKNRIMGAHCPELEEISVGAYYRLLKLNHTRKSEVKKSGIEHVTIDFAAVGPFCEPLKSSPLTMPTSPTTPGSEAKDVFFNFPSDSPLPPDVVLKTHDGYSMHAHKMVLQVASPNMLSILAKQDTVISQLHSKTDVEPLPVHNVQESLLVMRELLEFCYPIPSGQTSHQFLQVDHPLHYLDVLRAARKYQLSRAEQLLRGCWSEYLGKEPLRFYFAAAERGWTDEALESARELIRSSTDVLTIQTWYIPEMETMSNGAYYHLLQYINFCSQAVSSSLVIDGLPEPPCSLGVCDDPWWLTSKLMFSIAMDNPPSFLSSCLQSVKAELKKKPCRETVAMKSLSAKRVIAAVMSYRDASGFHGCLIHGGPSTKEREDGKVEWAIDFLDRFAAVVEEALAKVELRLPG